MARRAAAVHLDPEPYGVLVVVDAHFGDPLGETRGRALVPEGPAGAGPVVGLAGFDGLGQRLGIHIAVHQQLAGLEVGGDHRDQPVVIELGCELMAFLHLFDGGAGLKEIFIVNAHGGNSLHSGALYIRAGSAGQGSRSHMSFPSRSHLL